MIIRNIKEAEFEAKRFLKRVEEFKKEYSDEYKNKKEYWHYGSKESGALKRASMDLTRSLSKMRNNT